MYIHTCIHAYIHTYIRMYDRQKKHSPARPPRSLSPAPGAAVSGGARHPYNYRQ